MAFETAKSLLTGASRGALRGAGVGLGIMMVGGIIGALTIFTAGAGTLGLGALAFTVIAGAIGGVVAIPPLTLLVTGSCAAIGACYRGVSDFVDMAETVQEKDTQVAITRQANESAKKPPSVSTHLTQPIIEDKLPSSIDSKEIPKNWVKSVNAQKDKSMAQSQSVPSK